MSKPNKTPCLGVLVATLLATIVLVTVAAPPVSAAELADINTTLADYDHVVVDWATDLPAASVLVYGPTDAYGLLWFDTSPKTDHRVDLAGLSCESTYHFNVITIGAENLVTSSGDRSFETGPCPAANPSPAPLHVVASAGSAVVTWGSTIAGVGTVRYGPTDKYGTDVTETDSEVRFHRVELTDLECDSVYFFEALTRSGGGPIESAGALHFGTYACDPFVANIGIDTGATTATLTWTTDSVSTGSIVLGNTSDYDQEVQTGTQAQTQRIDVADLDCGTTYHYRIIAVDDAGNSFWTPDATFSTMACTATDALGADQPPNTSQPPEISEIVTAAGETSLLVSWATNEASSAAVTYTLARPDDQPENDQTLDLQADRVGVSHELLIVGLVCDTSYSLSAQSTDGSGLSTTTDAVVVDTLACGSDIEVSLTLPPPVQAPDDNPVELFMSDIIVRDITKTAAAVVWSTTAPALGSVAFGAPAELDRETASPIAGTTQRIVLVGLECGTTYSYNPLAHSPDGVTVVSGGVGNFATLPCQPTTISDAEVVSDQFSLTVSWLTDVPSDSFVLFGTNQEYGSASFQPTELTNHQVVLSDLDCNTTYNLRIVVDTGALVPTLSPNIQATTLACFDEPDSPPTVDPPPTVPPVVDPPVVDPPAPPPPDVEPPIIEIPPIDVPPVVPPIDNPPTDGGPDVEGPVVDPPVALTDIEVSTTDSTARITWLTDQATWSHLRYGPTTAYGSAHHNGAFEVQHVANLAGLQCATTYHFKVTATPAEGNAVDSADTLFTTGACAAEPFTITDVQVEAEMFDATITWTTTQDAGGRIEFGTAADLDETVENADLLPGHSFVLIGLDCGTQYSYRIEAARPDAFANTGVLTFITAACGAI